jgi:ribonuclease D
MKKQMMFKESITKEELTDLPLRWFDGEIVVVDNKEKLEQAVETLSKAKVIGFDTETKPAFKKGVFNKVALLQLSIKEQAFLFRINKIGLPVEICKILANPKIIKPGVAINDDIKALNKIKAFIPKGFVELQEHAKTLGITDFSLKKLAAITCGFRISKGQQLSNWEAEVLTDAQQIYAATDAWAALEIFENFSKN